MKSLEFLQPSSSVLRLEQHELDREANHLTPQAASTQTTARCPLCGGSTERIHSHYQRTLADLPCVDFTLTLLV